MRGKYYAKEECCFAILSRDRESLDLECASEAERCVCICSRTYTPHTPRTTHTHTHTHTHTCTLQNEMGGVFGGGQCVHQDAEADQEVHFGTLDAGAVERILNVHMKLLILEKTEQSKRRVFQVAVFYCCYGQ